MEALRLEFFSGLGWTGFTLCLLAALVCLASFLYVCRNRPLWRQLRPLNRLLGWGVLAGVYGALLPWMGIVGPFGWILGWLVWFAYTAAVVVILSKNSLPYGAATAAAWRRTSAGLVVSGVLLWVTFISWAFWNFANPSIH